MRWRNRRSVRFGWSLPASIELDDGQQHERCLIKDISINGARILWPASMDLPDRIVLWIDRGGGIGHRCRVLWRQDDQVGLEFITGATVFTKPKFAWTVPEEE